MKTYLKDTIHVPAFSAVAFLKRYGQQLTGEQISALPDVVYVLMDDVYLPGRGIVRKGFVFDGASVPRIGRLLIDKALLKEISIWHDAVYICKGKRENAVFFGDKLILKEDFTRKKSDKQFLEDAKAKYVPRFQRNLAYSAIRAAGWRLWNKKFRSKRISWIDPHKLNTK